MKRVLFFFLILAGGSAFSQTNFKAILETEGAPEAERQAIQSQLNTFLLPLSGSGRSDVQRLRKTFRKMHTTFLRKYKAYSDVRHVFSSGEYDCLTATVLFSHVLDQLNYSYEIIETNYHIFLMVHTSQGNVLLETTDRFGGFVTDEEAIHDRMAAYRDNQLTVIDTKKFIYEYSFKLYQKISSEKLVGLLYYNKAVSAFNQHNWLTSSMMLEKAYARYASPRCEELGPILIQSVLESSLTEEVKAHCLVRLRNFWIKKSETIAAN